MAKTDKPRWKAATKAEVDQIEREARKWYASAKRLQQGVLALE